MLATLHDLFTCHQTRHVAVMDDTGSSWQPKVPCTHAWHAIRSHYKGEVNSLTCYFRESDALASLSRLRTLLADVISGEFDAIASTCRASRQSGWFYTLNMTSATEHLGEDDWHVDVDNKCVDEAERVYLTAMVYTHAEWDTSAWGGHTHFVSRDDCPQRRDNCSGIFTHDVPVAPEALVPDLRIEPQPHRTVLFDARLMHRGSKPAAHAADRLATVMHIKCDRRASENTIPDRTAMIAPGASSADASVDTSRQEYPHTCVDAGPFLCLEAGCPESRTASCDILASVCHVRFADLWRYPIPAQLGPRRIRDVCRRACAEERACALCPAEAGAHEDLNQLCEEVDPAV